MAQSRRRSPSTQAWELAAKQHGVVTRKQLLGLGLSVRAIEHRLATSRLHPVHRGVYAVGRPGLSIHGRWLAAVLSCGPGAVLSHRSAAALWRLAPHSSGRIEVSVPGTGGRRRREITVHRRSNLSPSECTGHHGIAVTTPVCTLVDLAPVIGRSRLEAAISEADKLGLTDPESLREGISNLSPRPGSALLRETLDRRTFVLTDSELERRLLPIARRAGLGLPVTGARVSGFRVDFFWPQLGLVVETDGLRYHRTPAQQARDRVRDQAHVTAGLTCLRFTHAQVRFEPDRVHRTLAAVARRLSTPNLR